MIVVCFSGDEYVIVCFDVGGGEIVEVFVEWIVYVFEVLLVMGVW